MLDTVIQLYDASTTDFSHNGHVLQDVYNDTVTWQMNAKYELQFDYPLFSPYGFELVKERIITVPTPDEFDHDQAFRINQVTKSMGVVTVHAYHVFWDLMQNFIEDTNVVNKDGGTAINQILGATQFEHNFTATSNLSNVATARIVRMSAISALIGTDDNTFISRWGGEFEWDNFHFVVADKIGKDRGVVFRNGKNLLGYTAKEDTDTVITRIMPEGYNGLFLPEKYVDSPLINNYQTPRIAQIEYSDIKAIDENTVSTDDTALPLKDAYEALRNAAKAEYSKNNLDKPQTTFTLNVILLENTEEYRGKGQFNKVYPGDTATFIHAEDKVKTTAELTGYTWSPSQGEYLTVTFESASKVSPTISQSISSIKNQVTAIDTNVTTKAANGKNGITFSDKEPVDGVNMAVEGDLWYEQIGDTIDMWVFENGHWVNKVNDLTGKEIQAKVDDAIAEIPIIKDNISTAVAKGDQAIAKAGFASDTASAASQAATSAALTANTAAAGVIDAKNDAANAMTSAATAFNVANVAQDSAASAINSAASALYKVKNLQNGGRNYILNSNVNWTELFQHDIYLSQPLSFFVGKTITLSAQVDFDNAVVTGQSVHRIGFEMDTTNNSIKNWLTVIDGDSYHGRIIITMPFSLETSNQTNVWVNGGVQGFTADSASVRDIQLEIGNLASDYSQAPEDVQVQISDINGQLQSKVSQESYNQLTDTVTQTSTLAQQNQNALVSKADSSDVNVLKQRVTTAENTLTQTATKTELEQTKTDVDNINKTVQTNTSNITAQAGKIDGLLSTTSTLGNNYNTLENKFTASSGELSNSIKQVQTNVDNLSYTGRNYVLNSDVHIDTNDSQLAPMYSSVPISQLSGKKLVFSVNLDMDNVTAVSGNKRVGFEAAMTATDGQHWYSAWYYPKVGESYHGRVTGYYDFSDVTFTSNGTSFIEGIYIQGITADSIKVSRPQIAETAVQWSAAPEDNASTAALQDLSKQVTTNHTGIDQNSKLIALKTDESKVNALTDTVTNNASKLSVMSDSINGLSTKTQSVGDQLTTLSGQFNLSSQQLVTTMSKVDNMSIGGRNLIHDTSFEQGLWSTAFGNPSFEVTNEGHLKFSIINTGQNGVGTPLEPVEMLKQYTLTAKVRGHGKFMPYIMYNGISNMSLYNDLGATYPMIDSATEFVDIKYTFTPRYRDTTKQGVFAVLTAETVGNWLEIKKDSLKLEAGNIATDWSPAPEDQATVTALTQVKQTAEGAQALATNNQGDITNLQATAKGIQTTVSNNYSDLKSQNTQTAGLVQTLVGKSPSNIIKDGGFNSATIGQVPSGWDLPYGQIVANPDTTSNLVTAGHPVLQINGRATGNSDNYYGDRFDVQAGDQFYAEFKTRWSSMSQKGTIVLGVVTNDATGKTSWIGAAGISSPGSWAKYTGALTIPTGAVQVTDLVVRPAYATQAEMTLLSNDINLRVQKGDLLSQINIEAGQALISTNKLYLDAATVAFSGLAFIPSAAITELQADKITFGTMDGNNVNIVNLDAANIVTGTLSGANLKMNLNSGEVLFTHGSIANIDGSFKIDIDAGTMGVFDVWGQGIGFKEGKLIFTTVGSFGDGTEYGGVDYNWDLDLDGVAEFWGKNSAVMRSGDANTDSWYGLVPEGGKGGFVSLASNTSAGTAVNTTVYGDNGVRIYGGNATKTVLLLPPRIEVGNSNTDSVNASVNIEGNYINLTGHKDDFGGVGPADLTLAERMYSMNVYYRTYSNAANMYITSSGTFGRSTSASKYKLDIGDISGLTDMAHQFLSVQPKQWFDKQETETLVEQLTDGNTDYGDKVETHPYYGFIAEELYAAGLDRLVSYGEDGEIEGIEYDRLPVMHHELIRELFERVNELERRLNNANNSN